MRDTYKTVLSLLERYEEDGRYLNLSVPEDVEDKAYLTALLYSVVEHKLTLDYHISTLAGRSDLDLHTRNLLRLGLCRLLYFSVPAHAVVNGTVSLAKNKGEAGFVNAVLRRAASSPESLTLPDRAKNPVRYLSLRYSVPPATVRVLRDSLGSLEEAEQFLSATSQRAPTCLTVNGARTTRFDLVSLLREAGYEAEPSPFSTYGVTVRGSVPVPRLPGFEEGLFFVQDEAALLSVEALSPKEGQLVVDVCAAPGGKTFAALSHMGGQGRAVALELHESKLSLIRDGARRLGFSVDARAHDSNLPIPELIGQADCVICDVPCSGLGVLAKKPDLRYKSADTFSALPDLQNRLLETAFSYLKVGGRLVYSTCTVRPEENGEVIGAFLSTHREARSVSASAGTLTVPETGLTLLPHVHHTDGFFVAVLERIA